MRGKCTNRRHRSLTNKRNLKVTSKRIERNYKKIQNCKPTNGKIDLLNKVRNEEKIEETKTLKKSGSNGQT